eukprot:m.167253 g.167253  ORF g.167253 m.167253 type:complete len:474 (+) comp17191_c2_seq2:222-1643(+)
MDTSLDALLFGGHQAEAFCTAATLPGRSDYVDVELEKYGVPPLRLATNMANSEAAVAAVNGVHRVLELHRDLVSRVTGHETAMLKTSTQLSDMTIMLEKIKTEKESLARQLATITEKHRQLTVEVKTQAEALKAKDEELKKTKSNSAHLKTQYSHDRNRLERQVTELKDRLTKSLSDKSADRQMGIEFSQALQRQSTKRATWSGKGEEEMKKTIISNFEQRLRDVTSENHELRASLSTLHAELVAILKEREECEPNPADVSHELRKDHFMMPFELVKESIHQQLNRKLTAVKEEIERLRIASPTVSTSPVPKAYVEELQQQLDEYKRVVSTPQPLAHAHHAHPHSQSQPQSLSSSSQPSSSQPSPKELPLCEGEHPRTDAESLSQQRKLLEQERHTLEMERAHVTKAAQLLSEQRTRLLADKGKSESGAADTGENKAMADEFAQLLMFVNSPERPAQPPRMRTSTPIRLTKSD